MGMAARDGGTLMTFLAELLPVTCNVSLAVEAFSGLLVPLGVVRVDVGVDDILVGGGNELRVVHVDFEELQMLKADHNSALIERSAK